MRTFILLVALATFTGLTLAAGLTGTYKGTWASGNEGGGDLTMSFSPGDANTIKADVSLNNGGETTKCDVKTVTVEGSKVELVLNYEVNGERYEAMASGVLDGKMLSGTYKTKSLSDGSAVDSGTWKTTGV